MDAVIVSITNLEQLQHGGTAQHRFDRRGGTIGSEGACWLVTDRANLIAPVHCEIRWTEGKFCILDHCNRTYINDEPLCLGSHAPRCLLEGDTLRVGSCLLRVHFQSDQDSHQTLDELLSTQQRVLDALIAEVPVSTWQSTERDKPPIADICTVVAPEVERDPLKALDAASDPALAHDNALHGLITGGRS